MFEREDYTADQGSLADFVGQLAEDFDAGYFLSGMRKGESPSHFWSILSEGGYLGILAPEEWGGADSSLEDLVVLTHQMARSGMASHRLMNQLLCCDLLARFGSDAQKKEHIPKIISGSVYTLAVMEQTEGEDLFDIGMEAASKGDGYELNGTKGYVACADEASHLLVAARTGDSISLFLVPASAEGLEKAPQEVNVRVTGEEEMTLITGDRFFDLTFSGVNASMEDRLGDEGVGQRALESSFHLQFLLVAVAAIGWGECVLEKAVEYAKHRTVFEDPIGSYQALQHPLVRARTELEMAKLTVPRAVSAMARGEKEAGVYASIAKCAATDAAFAACDISLQAHGGYGFDRETGVITLWPLILLSRILPLNNDVILEKFAGPALELA